MQDCGHNLEETVMSKQVIEFFWDPASPYTYLASTQIEAVAARCGVGLTWKPFLLGGVFEATGNKAPAQIPAKGKYLFSDIQLWARHYGVPLSFPKSFPVKSILPLRVACAAAEAGRGPEFAKAVMAAHWAKGIDISQPAELVHIATAVGIDGAALLARAQDQLIKDQLRANTDEATKRGAFGAPTMYVGQQMFWGNDRLVLLEDYLKGKLAA
jgi:2-hydroxychromene-2-carboxylate isomerase